jgi:F-type H+-transporting ATPase subunit b
VDLLAVAGALGRESQPVLNQAAESAGLQINLFWVIVSSLNFLVFAVLLYVLFGRTVTRMLEERRARIEQGLRDAEQARLDRESAETERLAALAEARREAKEILDRSQKVAQETRDADIAATRAELERMRERAEQDIQAEKQRAIADLREEVANLALEAASKVVGESMTDERHRRLVEDFLRETATTEAKG